MSLPGAPQAILRVYIWRAPAHPPCSPEPSHRSHERGAAILEASADSHIHFGLPAVPAGPVAAERPASGAGGVADQVHGQHPEHLLRRRHATRIGARAQEAAGQGAVRAAAVLRAADGTHLGVPCHVGPGRGCVPLGLRLPVHGPARRVRLQEPRALHAIRAGRAAAAVPAAAGDVQAGPAEGWPPGDHRAFFCGGTRDTVDFDDTGVSVAGVRLGDRHHDAVAELRGSFGQERRSEHGFQWRGRQRRESG